MVNRTANLLRRLGVGPDDTVAYVLPNGIEAPVALLAGATAGIVQPINPLLTPEHVGGLLAETRAKVVITLAPFPKTDLAQKVAAALAHAPEVRAVLEVDLARYVPGPMGWVASFMRPKIEGGRRAETLDFHKAIARERGTRSTSRRRTRSGPAPGSTREARRDCPRSRSTARGASSTTAGAACPTCSRNVTC
jgi:fatty-acyl-CoA synthase